MADSDHELQVRKTLHNRIELLKATNPQAILDAQPLLNAATNKNTNTAPSQRIPAPRMSMDSRHQLKIRLVMDPGHILKVRGVTMKVGRIRLSIPSVPGSIQFVGGTPGLPIRRAAPRMYEFAQCRNTARSTVPEKPQQGNLGVASDVLKDATPGTSGIYRPPSLRNRRQTTTVTYSQEAVDGLIRRMEVLEAGQTTTTQVHVELAQAKAEVAQLQANSTQAQADITQLRADLEQTKAELMAVRAKIARETAYLDTDISNLRAHCSTVGESLAALEDRVHALDGNGT